MSEELKDHCPAHNSSHAACARCIEAKRAVEKAKTVTQPVADVAETEHVEEKE